MSPEGLIYVTVAHELETRKKKPARKKKKAEKGVIYASLDFNKTGKISIMDRDDRRKRGRKKKRQRKV